MAVLITIDELPMGKVDEIQSIVSSKVFFVGRDEVIPYADIEILITYGFEISAKFLDSLPNLKWIQILQTGIEHIPLNEVDKRNIILSNIQGIYGTGMSEYVMSLVLFEVREIERFIQNKKEKRYERSELVDEVENKTIGIFGTGTIGQEVAKKAQAFNMNVLGFNTSGRSVEHFNKTYTWDKKEELIRKCDFIVLLLPLIDETYHFFGAEEFAMMKRSAYLINIGRGPLINESDLLKALENNEFKGAAVDVFDEEPLPQSSKLWNAEKVFITPHLSGKTKYFFDRGINLFKIMYQEYVNKESLKYQIDIKRGY